MIKYECPYCEESMQSPESMAGRMETCPNCEQVVEVPESASALRGRSLEDRPAMAGEMTKSAGSHQVLEETPSPDSRFSPPESDYAVERVWVASSRYVGAVLAYWAYWPLLWIAAHAGFYEVIAGKEARLLVDSGAITSVWEYGWGDHYVWYLILFCAVAACCSILTGAIAKKHGALVAGIANVPVVLLVAGLAYLHYTGQTSTDSPIAWGIVFPLAGVASVVASIVGGLWGEETQEAVFGAKTALGIHPLHWAWIWLPALPYAMGLAVTVARVVHYDWAMADRSVWSVLLGVLLLIPLSAFVYPSYLMYQILSQRVMVNEKVALRVSALVGVYLLGLTLAFGLDWACMKVLDWMTT